jgi:hypothetical protein
VSYVGPCVHCGEPVQSFQVHVFKVEGYEETRSQGGANKVMERTRVPDLVWHRACWELWLHSGDGQGRLL